MKDVNRKPDHSTWATPSITSSRHPATRPGIATRMNRLFSDRLHTASGIASELPTPATAASGQVRRCHSPRTHPFWLRTASKAKDFNTRHPLIFPETGPADRPSVFQQNQTQRPEPVFPSGTACKFCPDKDKIRPESRNRFLSVTKNAYSITSIKPKKPSFF